MPTFSGSAASGISSYGSINEVIAFTARFLDGQSTFNSTTMPTSTQISKFLDRVSYVLNSALATRGFATPVTDADVKLALDDWVVANAAAYVEMTHRGTGYSEAEGSRQISFRNLHQKAMEFVKNNELGWKRMGATVTWTASAGLSFTGLDAVSERADPSDTSLAQPKFRRGLFDDPGGSGAFSADDEDENN